MHIQLFNNEFMANRTFISLCLSLFCFADKADENFQVC